MQPQAKPLKLTKMRKSMRNRETKRKPTRVVALQQKEVAEAASKKVLKNQQDASKVRKTLSDEVAKREAAEALARIDRIENSIAKAEKAKKENEALRQKFFGGGKAAGSPPAKKLKRTITASKPVDAHVNALIAASKAVQRDHEDGEIVGKGPEAENLTKAKKKHRAEVLKGKGKAKLSPQNSENSSKKAKKAAEVAQRRVASMGGGSIGNNSEKPQQFQKERDELKALKVGPCHLKNIHINKFMNELLTSLRSKVGEWKEEEKVLQKKSGEDNCQYVLRVTRADRGIAIKKQVGSGVSGSVFFGSSAEHVHAIKAGVLDDNFHFNDFWYAVHAHQEVYAEMPISVVPMPSIRAAHTLLRKRKQVDDGYYAFAVTMSYLHGVVLSALIKNAGETEKIKKLAKSLRILHDSGFCHGDAHLQNFMQTFRESEPVGIVDFDRSIKLSRLEAKPGADEAEKGLAGIRIRGAIAYDIRFALTSLNRAFQTLQPDLLNDSAGLWRTWVEAFVKGYTNKENQQEVKMLYYRESLDDLTNFYRHSHAQNLYREYYPILQFARQAMMKEKQDEFPKFRPARKK